MSTKLKKRNRLYKSVIDAYDLKKGSSNVRLIEMIVDSITDADSGVRHQFWRDMGIYGFRESITYLQNYISRGKFKKEYDQLDKILLDLENKIK